MFTSATHSSTLKETHGLQPREESKLNLNAYLPRVFLEKRLLKALRMRIGSKGWNKAPV